MLQDIAAYDRIKFTRRKIRCDRLRVTLEDFVQSSPRRGGGVGIHLDSDDASPLSRLHRCPEDSRTATDVQNGFRGWRNAFENFGTRVGEIL